MAVFDSCILYVGDYDLLHPVKIRQYTSDYIATGINGYNLSDLCGPNKIGQILYEYKQRSGIILLDERQNSGKTKIAFLQSRFFAIEKIFQLSKIFVCNRKIFKFDYESS